VSGTASNNTTYQITGVTALALTVTPAPVNESTGAAVLTGTHGNTSRSYFIVCHDFWGHPTLPSAPTTIQNNSSLNGNNQDMITWTIPDGAVGGCDVLTPDTSHLLATVAWPLNGAANQGQATTAYSYLPRATNADAFFDGNGTFGGGLTNLASNGVLTATAASQTLATSSSTGTDTALSTVWSAFQFTATTTEIGGVSVWLKNGSGISTSSTIAAYLFSDSSGVPGTVLSDPGLTSTGQPTIIFSGTLSTSYAPVPFRLPVTTLTVGTKYWVVLLSTVSGGNFNLDTASSGTNLVASAPDSSGSPGTWTGAAKAAHFTIDGASGDGTKITAQNGHAVHGVASGAGFAGYFEALGGGGALKANAVDNFAVGGFSIWSNGGRFTSTNGIALSSISANGTGGQIQTQAAGQVGLQVVATTGAAVQPVGSGLLWQGLDAANSFAQTSTISNTGNITAGGGANPVPVVHSTQTTSPVAMEFGTKVLAAGTGSVTFATAFSSAPVCTLGEATAANAVKYASTTTTLTITGTSTDSISWICAGAK
jgi:hypothetical protein